MLHIHMGVIEGMVLGWFSMMLLYNVCCKPSLESSHLGDSNQGSEHVFLV